MRVRITPYQEHFYFHTSKIISVSSANRKKVCGKEVPEELDTLLEEMAENQLKANYRKSLGREHARRSWDLEIEKIFRKKRK